MVGDKKAADLEDLIKEHRANKGDDLTLTFAEARLKILQKQPVEAAALFQKAYQKQKEDGRRRQCVYRFLDEMFKAGLPLEGYRAAPDKAAALETLAYRLVADKKEKELAALLEEHGKGQPEDPVSQHFRGELFLLRGDAKQAESCFTAALAKSSPQGKWRPRHALFRLRVKAGKAVSAYQEFEPGTVTFESLANLCLQEKDAKQLQALIEVHRQAKPDDQTLAVWDLDLKWLNQDYQGVVQVLTAAGEEFFNLPRYQWKRQDYLVRSLVKLKQLPGGHPAGRDSGETKVRQPAAPGPGACLGR